MKRTIILTGGRGRLASSFTKQLKDQGHEVLAFSRTEGDSYLNLSDLFTSGLLERCCTIVHTAWGCVPLTSESHVGIEWDKDLPFLFKLLKGTLSQDGTTKAHFIFFSSGGAVYGNAGARCSREEDPLRPIGWHGFGKMIAEQMITEFSRRTGLSSTILRISNVYGLPVAASHRQGIIPNLVAAAKDDAVFTIWGDGNARKDYLYLSDFTDALLEVLEHRTTGIYNLGSGISHSVIDIISVIEDLTGKKIRTRHIPPYPWDVNKSCLDISKICRAISWLPRVDLETGIRLML